MEFNVNSQTPFPYAGAKKVMMKYILPLIPEHRCYVEPFVGSAIIFYGKTPSFSSVINDKSNAVINFYRVFVNKYDELNKLVQSNPYSRTVFKHCKHIIKNPQEYNDVEQAFAFYYLNVVSYLYMQQSFGYDISTPSKATKEAPRSPQLRQFFKRVDLYNSEGIEFFKKKLEYCYIENDDANTVIKRYDTVDTFHYCDPPYVGTKYGKSYHPYTTQDYISLLETLSNIKGKFLLSSFKNEINTEFIAKHGWFVAEVHVKSSATKAKANETRDTIKTEILIANYPIPETITPLTTKNKKTK